MSTTEESIKGKVSAAIKKALERRRAQFKKFADIRVNKALRQLELVQQLAQRKRYEWTQEQAAKIVTALRSKADEIEQRFAAKDEAPRSNFSL
jgi:hypothetical protein